jgi:hypothetical protein
LGKKNYRKIPPPIFAKINGIAVDDVVVACAKKIPRGDISRYAHLGLRLEADSLVLPGPVIPPVKAGKYSRTNTEGKTVVRRDLPMIQKTHSFEAPNWGGHGTHTVQWARDMYERDFIPPKGLTLSMELLPGAAGGSDTFPVKFSIDQVLARSAPDFKEDLLYNLNLLQENVGAANVFASTATLAEYLQTMRVEWEILPVGTVSQVLASMLQGKRPVSEEQRDTMEERLTFLASLQPRNYVAGTSEFLRYFGVQFGDDFVVFENLQYGNAAYVMYEDWQILSRRTRIDLLKGPRGSFEHVPHTGDWQGRIKTLLQEYRMRTQSKSGPTP